MVKTRILYIDHAVTLGGGERSLLELTAALDRSRFEPIFALPGPGPLAATLSTRGERVLFFEALAPVLALRRTNLTPWSPAAWWAARRAMSPVGSLRRLIRTETPDIVHTNSQKAHIWGTIATMASDTPLVIHMRDIIGPRWARFMVDAAAATRAARVVAISNAVARQFIWARPKVTTIYNAVAEPAVLSSKTVERLHAAWELPPGAQVAGYVGQLAPWKGQHVFVEAATFLAKALPRLYFVVIGGPLYGAVSYRDELKRQVAAAGLTKRFRWLGQHPDAAALIGAFDVLVHLPVEPEPFGRVVAEAMARAIPVVAATSGAIPELITNGCEGLLCPEGDAWTAAAAIGRVLTDREAADAMGRRGRVAYDHRFRLALLTAEVSKLYDHLGPNPSAPVLETLTSATVRCRPQTAF